MNDSVPGKKAGRRVKSASLLTNRLAILLTTTFVVGICIRFITPWEADPIRVYMKSRRQFQIVGQNLNATVPSSINQPTGKGSTSDTFSSNDRRETATPVPTVGKASLGDKAASGKFAQDAKQSSSVVVAKFNPHAAVPMQGSHSSGNTMMSKKTESHKTADLSAKAPLDDVSTREFTDAWLRGKLRQDKENGGKISAIYNNKNSTHLESGENSQHPSVAKKLALTERYKHLKPDKYSRQDKYLRQDKRSKQDEDLKEDLHSREGDSADRQRLQDDDDSAREVSKTPSLRIRHEDQTGSFVLPASQIYTEGQRTDAAQKTLKSNWMKTYKQGAGKKILLVRGAGGFANSINGLLSGAVYALLHDRRLQFDSIYNAMFEAAKMGWNVESAYYKPHRVDGKSPPGFRSYIDKTCFPSDSRLAIKMRQGEFLEATDPWRGRNVAVSKIKTNCPMFRHWATNPNLQPRMEEIGLINRTSEMPVGFQVGHRLLKLLLEPVEELETLIDETFGDVVRANFLIIGIQIRSGGKSFGDKAEFGPSSMDWASYFFDCAKMLANGLGKNHKVKYYVSTDRPSMLDEAMAYFGEDAVMQGPGTVKHTSKVRNTKDMGLYRAAIDSIYLGKYASALVITPGSTFGTLAAMSWGHNPYHVHLDEGPDQYKCVKTDLTNLPPRYHLPQSQLDSPFIASSDSPPEHEGR